MSELGKEAIICSPVTSVLVFESCKPSLASLNFSAARKCLSTAKVDGQVVARCREGGRCPLG
jgi:hypothetical protein